MSADLVAADGSFSFLATGCFFVADASFSNFSLAFCSAFNRRLSSLKSIIYNIHRLLTTYFNRHTE